MNFKVVVLAVSTFGVIACGGSADELERADSAARLPSAAEAPNSAGDPAKFLPIERVERGALGDSTQGPEFAETCSPEELLVGLNVGVKGWVEQVSGVCQSYSLRANVSGTPFGYSFELGARHELAPHPALTTSRVQPLMCPEGTVMVGVNMTEQHSALGTAGDRIVIPQLAIDCAAPFLTDSQLEWRDSIPVGPAVGSLAPAGDWYTSDLLNNSEVLVGYHGAAGTEVDRVGLIATSLDLPVASNTSASQ